MFIESKKKEKRDFAQLADALVKKSIQSTTIKRYNKQFNEWSDFVGSQIEESQIHPGSFLSQKDKLQMALSFMVYLY